MARISRPLQFGGLDRELALAAREVVVDRTARSLADLGHVAQLHPRVALLGEQPPCPVEQPFATVAAARPRSLPRLQFRDSMPTDIV